MSHEGLAIKFNSFTFYMSNKSLLSCPPLISLFVACYNESGNIVDTLCTICDACTEVGISYEILVIDDASTDGSVEIIHKWMNDYPMVPIRLIKNSKNQGIARNFIAGSRLAKGEWYRMVNGDNVEPKETLITIFRKIGYAEVIVPYHVICHKKVWSRKVISSCYTWIVNFLSGYYIRYYNGLPVTRRKHVETFCYPTLNFCFQADFIIQLLDSGLSWLEVCVPTHERRKGVSHAFSVKNFLAMSILLKRLLIRRWKWLKYKIRPQQAEKIITPNLPEI